MKRKIPISAAAGWARSSVGLGCAAKPKKLCAACLKPFHKVKRPKAATFTKQHQGITQERSVCRACLEDLEQRHASAGEVGEGCGSFQEVS